MEYARLHRDHLEGTTSSLGQLRGRDRGLALLVTNHFSSFGRAVSGVLHVSLLVASAEHHYLRVILTM